ncbi:DoxX family protein [Microvirga sp. GCM10011540]|uniref:DoxX family protein n=1 Tax=Microvirga sp. GCM10011540 TaxID=3317338 RepID=UPI00361FC0EC
MNMTNGILLAGRLLVAASFAPPAVAHMSNISGFAARISAKSIPYGDIMAATIALTEVVGPLAIVIGLAPRLSASALVAASVIATGIMHRFWELEGAARQMEQSLFIAQLGTIAALLLYLVTGPGAWSLQGWWHGNAPKRKPPAKKRASRPRTSRPGPSRPSPADEELADAR